MIVSFERGAHAIHFFKLLNFRFLVFYFFNLFYLLQLVVNILLIIK